MPGRGGPGWDAVEEPSGKQRPVERQRGQQRSSGALARSGRHGQEVQRRCDAAPVMAPSSYAAPCCHHALKLKGAHGHCGITGDHTYPYISIHIHTHPHISIHIHTPLYKGYGMDGRIYVWSFIKWLKRLWNTFWK